MSEFLYRKATVSVFAQDVFTNVKTGSIKVTNIDKEGQSYSNINKDGSPGFRIRFDVLTNTADTMNPTSIYIYNLGPDSRARFERRHSKIALSAGYEGNEGEIFVGVVARVRTRKEGPDYVTHIEAKDGLLAHEGSTINQSFGQPTSLTDAVTSVVKSFEGSGIALPNIPGLNLPTKTYHSGIALSGKSITVLNQILKGSKLSATILKESLLITAKGEARGEGEQIFVLSTDTGMVGIPEVGESGITVNSLLNPQLEAFKRIIIKSRFVNGIYRMVTVRHAGDTFQGDFMSKIEVGKSQPLRIKTGSSGIESRDPDGKSPIEEEPPENVN